MNEMSHKNQNAPLLYQVPPTIIEGRKSSITGKFSQAKHSETTQKPKRNIHIDLDGLKQVDEVADQLNSALLASDTINTALFREQESPTPLGLGKIN